MTFLRAICFALLLLPLFSVAQKIQYSRQTFPYSFADETQLVADVGGYHHVLRFKLDNKPAVFIFNSQLEYTGKVDIDLEVKETSDIRIVPMQGYYYLYSHVPKSTAHYIFKIGGSGDVENKTAALEKLLDSANVKSKATYQLQNSKNRLYLISNSYYDELKKIGSTIVETDEDWKNFRRSVVLYPFDKEKETLQQVLFSDDKLFVLKTGIDEENGNTLQVIKANLPSDSLLLNTFTTETSLYQNPAMQYSSRDSSLTVFATMRGEPNARRQQTATFISRLNDQLHEVKPVTLYKTPPRRNIIAGFLLLQGNKPIWTTPVSQVLVQRSRNQPADFGGTNFDSPTFNLFGKSGRIEESRINYGQPTSVSFTVLNEQDKAIGDTVIENNGSYFDLQPRPNAQFTIDSTVYLLFLQNFSAKQKGLVMVHANRKGRVFTTPLPVFDRYEYLLPQTQATKDFFLVPYRYKRELGLLKVSIQNNEKKN